MTIWNWLAIGISLLSIAINIYVLAVDIAHRRRRDQINKQWMKSK